MHHMKSISEEQVQENCGSVRASVSFPTKYYQEIEKIALANRVSVAWVVREAVIEYLSTKTEDKQ
jgi:metal-responsive CopG/Arc/MetJ family transcriptional regulator